MRKVLLLLLVIVTVMAALAWAEPVTISSGATFNSTFMDIKGQPLTGGNATLQLGAIYTLAGGPVVTTTSDDTGLVRGSLISRETDTTGSGIVLAWSYASYFAARKADIWRSFGPGKQFSTTPADWTQIASNISGPKWTDNVAVAPADAPKVGDGNNAYYRIVPAGTVAADIFLPANNSRTVGKVDVDFPKGYTLFETPVWTTDMTLPLVIGNQLDNKAGGDELYDYSMNKATYASGVWVGNPLSFEKGRGYYLRILNTPKKITFVGIVELKDTDLSLSPSYSMVGNPYPLTKNVTDIFKNVAVGEELYDKFANKKTYTAGGWVGATYNFGIGDGFWFRRMTNSAYNWQLRP